MSRSVFSTTKFMHVGQHLPTPTEGEQSSTKLRTGDQGAFKISQNSFGMQTTNGMVKRSDDESQHTQLSSNDLGNTKSSNVEICGGDCSNIFNVVSNG